MNKTYAVLGSGMQGTAAAYDLALHANPTRIVMGDLDPDQSQTNADRINRLVGRDACVPAQVNALDSASLAKFLEPVDVLLSCVPYWMHPQVAAIAIATRTSMVDMGGDTDVSLKTLALNEDAKAASVSIVPDTGLAPGLVNNLGAYFIENLDEVDTIKLYCGGLPQNPKPPFNYKLVFNIEGLVTEYVDQARVIRNGEVEMVDTLDELEILHVEGLGEMEAFTTSGGTSTAPYTFKDRVRNYDYKTIRFPGHCEKMRIFMDFGFWNTEKIAVHGQLVEPREVFHRLMGPRLRDDADVDQVVVRGVGMGTRGGKHTTLQIDIHDKFDHATGFSAMERMTGFSTATIAKEVADGLVPVGCVRYEEAMSGTKFVEEIQKRGIRLAFSTK